jgi:hypothetical protein
MRLLRRVLLLMVVTVVVLTAPRTAVAADTYGGVSFHPFTLDAANGTCRPTQIGTMATNNCDPVNLLFPGKTWQQVRTALQARGWKAGTGSTQSVYFPAASGGGTLVPQQVQLFSRDGAGRQYHVRLFQAPSGGLTLGAVHYEDRDGWGHVIVQSWDFAESFVRGQFCGTGSAGAACESADLPDQRAIQAVEYSTTVWRNFANNAVATVVP